MDEILEKIKNLESYSNKKQQWDLIREIEGNLKEIDEKEQKDIEEFNKEKTELIDILKSKTSDGSLKGIVNDVETAKNHLLALRGMLLITKFEDTSNMENELKKFEISILKDLKNKTLDQEIEIVDADSEVETLKKEKEKKEEKEELQEYDNQYGHPTQTTKNNIFTRIKLFFISRFGRTKRLEQQNRIQWEEDMKITKESMAGIEKSKDNGEIAKTVNEKNKEIAKNELKERVKVSQNSYESKPCAVWKNGNVVIIKDDEEQLENDK